MSQSYEQLIEDLRERNRNGLIFLPFESLHKEILMDGNFDNVIYTHKIDHPNVTVLDSFILADVFINNKNNDHFTIGRVPTESALKGYTLRFITNESLAQITSATSQLVILLKCFRKIKTVKNCRSLMEECCPKVITQERIKRLS